MVVAFLRNSFYPLTVVFFPVDWIVAAGGIFAIVIIVIILLSLITGKKRK